ISSILVAVGTARGSFCRPSRGPTSTMRMLRGRLIAGQSPDARGSIDAGSWRLEGLLRLDGAGQVFLRSRFFPADFLAIDFFAADFPSTAVTQAGSRFSRNAVMPSSASSVART